ncbi:hypothetical protein [Arcticibacterium luteifluviistationis]|uniref:DUF4468 domain-containing protein n=1 Tax=Arcticibacterium luteifluviistationis TaxID=1784714 RepID=A0A2Z4GC55_9BACT|nr:hypothetical protein [Arcticibacterium luteifluviistationis]AWV98717.1 hypothetical protein DJ013_11245 [Arcticibacterium luteifluviistationis]
MKKITAFLLFICLTAASSTFGQHILKSSTLYEGEVFTTDYIFIRSEAKSLEKDWKTYLSKTGSVSDDKDLLTVKVNSSDISRDLDKIISYIVDHKEFSAVHVILLDDNNRSLNVNQINPEALERLLFDFYDLAYYNEELRMANTDLELAEKLHDNAEKSKSRAERALASNLKSQEKYGKKLSQSPEKLAEIIHDKNEVYQQILQRDVNATDSTETDPDDLDKEFSKQEKKIIKTRNLEEKNADRLIKAEKEFEGLTDDLIAARVELGKATQVLESKKVVIQDLKKK